MNTSLPFPTRKGWIACFCLLAAALVSAPSAHAVLLRSPETHHTWAVAQLDHKQFYWDDQTGFAVALTYTTAPYASRGNPPESETLLFHFPGIRHVSGAGRFVLDQRDGPVTVARKGFLGSIRLTDGNRLVIERHSSTVKAVLAIGE